MKRTSKKRQVKANEYEWTCKLPSIPRIGDEISLPDLEGGGPLYHKDTLWAASNAVVKDVTWFLDDDLEVAVYCVLRLEYPDQPNQRVLGSESPSVPSNPLLDSLKQQKETP